MSNTREVPDPIPESRSPTSQELQQAVAIIQEPLREMFNDNTPQVITTALEQITDSKLIDSKIYLSCAECAQNYNDVSDRARFTVNLSADLKTGQETNVEMLKGLATETAPQVYMNFEQGASLTKSLGIEQYLDDIVPGSAYYETPLYFIVDWGIDDHITKLQLPSYIIDKYKDKPGDNEPVPVTIILGEQYSQDDLDKIFLLMCEDIKEKMGVDFEKMYDAAREGKIDDVMALPENSQKSEGFPALLKPEYLS